jgi:hypothetical protein
MLHPNPMTEEEKYRNESIKASAVDLEEVPKAQYKMLQKIAAPNIYNTALKANKDVEKLIVEKPNDVAAVSELVRREGAAAALLAKGIGVHVGPYGASFSLNGLSDAQVAALPLHLRDTFDKMSNALAKSVYYDMIARGIDPEKIGAEAFGQRMLQEAGMAQGSAAIHRTIEENKARLEHAKKIHDVKVKLLPKMTALHSLTPHYDLDNNHPEIQVLNKMFENKLAKIQ